MSMTFVDFQQIICRRLEDAGIAAPVYAAEEPVHLYRLPAITVAMSSQSGNACEGWWEAMVTVSCIAAREPDAYRLAHDVRAVLDGFGGYGVADISHISTVPVRVYDTAPVTQTYAMTFRVLYQEL